eukprot:SAG11_NODE_19858_length_457_cov_1.209497_1_plen_64_part_00
MPVLYSNPIVKKPTGSAVINSPVLNYRSILNAPVYSVPIGTPWLGFALGFAFGFALGFALEPS